MRIINVLEMTMGLVNKLTSFPVIEEQLSEEVVENAEKFFIERCSSLGKQFTEEETESMLEEGYYIDNGNEFFLIWSE